MGGIIRHRFSTPMQSQSSVKVLLIADSDIVAFPDGNAYRIPSPIRLLKAKLANLREISPTRPQDAQHVRLLVSLVPEYIREQHRHVLAARLSERVLINALNELKGSITGGGIQKLEAKFDLDLGPALPRDLPSAKLPKLSMFYQHLKD